MAHPITRASLLLLLACCCLLAQAAEPVGRVLLARGDVTATGSDGVVRKLIRRAEVRESDVLLTGADGMLQVRFDDGATVELRAGSRLEIAVYRYNRPDEGQNSVLMEIFAGAMRAISGIVGSEAYEVRTPVASIGIRGTHYETAAERDGAWVYGVWDGGVRVANEAGAVDLGADVDFLFARARPGAAPVGLVSPPAALAAATAGGADGDSEDSAAAGGGLAASDASALAAPAAPARGGAPSNSGDGAGESAGRAGLAATLPINPAEGVGSEEELEGLREVFFASDFGLSPREQAGLASGRERGILVLADGRVVTGLATTGDEGGPLFLVSLEDDAQALVRGGAGSADDPSQNVVGFDVSWGSFAAAEPEVFIRDESGVRAGRLSGDLTFLMIEAAQLSDLNVRAAFSGSEAIGTTSAGEITSFGVFFDADLDLGSGLISDGHLLLEAAGGREEYRVNFAGRVTDGEALLGISRGAITGTGIDGTLEIDRDLSVLQGLFTTGDGFAGGFNLQEAGNAERFARGGFVAEKIGATDAPPAP